jgi:hypothetical protein
VILTDQLAALDRVDQLVDAELWRNDRRERWMRMLRRLVHSMDWTSGLICGVTAAQLATTGGCSPRTVSRLLAWAQDVRLLVVVEQGAAAAFLGSVCNRAPAYVFVAPATPPDGTPPQPQQASSQLNDAVHENGDLSDSYANSKPLTDSRRPSQSPQPPREWPLWQIPTTPTERSAAVATLLRRINLGSTRAPAWRARALLHQWWTEGACVAGLLYAIDHHPDHLTQHRGDALRAATDPLRVLGYRLRPWVGQLHRLPPHLAGRHGDYQARQAARVAEGIALTESNPARRVHQVTSTAAVREAARAALTAVLADHARRREAARGLTGPAGSLDAGRR